MESGEINWDLCILCQESTSEPLRSTEEGIQSRSNSLLQFKAINALSCQLSILCSENCELKFFNFKIIMLNITINVKVNTIQGCTIVLKRSLMILSMYLQQK